MQQCARCELGGLLGRLLRKRGRVRLGRRAAAASSHTLTSLLQPPTVDAERLRELIEGGRSTLGLSRWEVAQGPFTRSCSRLACGVHRFGERRPLLLWPLRLLRFHVTQYTACHRATATILLQSVNF